MLWLLCSLLGNTNHLWFMGHFDWVCSCFVSSEQWKAAERDSSTLSFLNSKSFLICHPPSSIILHTPFVCIPLSWLYLQILVIPLAHMTLLPLYAKLVLNSGGVTSCRGHQICWGWQQNLPALPPSYLVQRMHMSTFLFITPPGRGLRVSLLVQQTSMVPPTFLSACL